MATPAADRTASRPLRAWTVVDVVAQDTGFAVRLDDRVLRTPSGSPLVLPTRALADAVAAEWSAQANEVGAPIPPLTRLACTAMDKGDVARDGLAEELVRYAGSDALTYFDDATVALREEECRRWGPLLNWSADTLGVRLVRAEGVMHRPQPAGSLARVRALVLAEEAFVLVGLAYAAALFGSTVLALALRHGRLDAEQAHDLARLEEAWQARQWGEDAEAADRTARRLAEARTAARWFAALTPPGRLSRFHRPPPVC